MKVAFTFRLPYELKDKLREMADKKGKTLSGLIIEILWSYIEK